MPVGGKNLHSVEAAAYASDSLETIPLSHCLTIPLSH